MTEWISPVVPGGHDECRRAAGSLRSVAAVVGDARAFAGRGAVPSLEEFDGVSANAYREATSRIRHDAAGLERDLRSLAAALDAYADRVVEVRRVMLLSLIHI